MSKTLIIAEKPSVATDIAKALGGFKKVGDYFESEDRIITSAVGHLLELCLPADLDKKKGKWSFDNLPVVPKAFALKPVERTLTRLKLIKKLIKNKEVETLVNACDAGREGELIFRYIVQHCATKKNIKRLWLQSMTADSIREGFNTLKSDKSMLPLAAAAVSRSESDWLIGINGTRALTALNSRGGGFFLTTVGRVQTPTLAVVVTRDLEIKSFDPKTYWNLEATFKIKNGEYEGRWVDKDFVRPEKGSKDAGEKKADRIWEKEKAVGIKEKCSGKAGEVEEEKKVTSQLSPLLYDLTGLQRDANARFGISAKRTLQIAQALYEKHKVLTYPRTDSKALPEDYVATVKGVLGSLESPHAEKVLKERWVVPSKRIFNNKKISDHHAIIPTKNSPSKLNEFEHKIYDMVAKRFIAVFYPAAKFEVVTRLTKVEGEHFKTEGKILKEVGWLAVYGKSSSTGDGEGSLLPVEEGEKAHTESIALEELETKPPARFSEATLLSAMEGAGKFVEDEALREAMGKKGLGTPATRAAIIERLIYEKYLERGGRELLATPKAFALMDLLKATKIEELRSPEMTGDWEDKLKKIEEGEFTREQFMGEIGDLTKRIVEVARAFDESSFETRPMGINSPTDGSEMVETMRYYQTKDGSYRINKVIAGRFMEIEEIKELLEKKFIGPLSDFRSRKGWAFSAALKLGEELKPEFVFDNDGEGGAIDFSELEVIGNCPIHPNEKVYEAPMAFLCEKAGEKPKACELRVSKKILSQDISREQFLKLINEKKTDVLTGFVSQRTKRAFKAFLVLKDDGKVGFEFPEKKTKSKKKK